MTKKDPKSARGEIRDAKRMSRKTPTASERTTTATIQMECQEISLKEVVT